MLLLLKKIVNHTVKDGSELMDLHLHGLEEFFCDMIVEIERMNFKNHG